MKVAIATLTASGKERVAAVALLCRELGLRRREALLLNVRLAQRQAASLGRVNIVAGTKGGRGKSIDRWVPVFEQATHAIRIAVATAAGHSKLVPADASLSQWLTRVSREWTQVAAPLGLGSLRELRAAYACDRYQQLTGRPAPAVAGARFVEKRVDRAARSVLSQELGHNRIDVLAAYVGSAR